MYRTRDTENDWKDIHPKFHEVFQERWEIASFNYEETKEWIKVGLTPHDESFALHLECEGISPERYSKKTNAKKEKLREMYTKITIGEVLDEDLELKKNREIDLSRRGLVGSLKIEGLTELERLTFSKNQLTKLEVINCPKLKSIECSKNKLSTLNIKDCPNLTVLDCENNTLAEPDFLSTLNTIEELNLSGNSFFQENLTFFSRFENLKHLRIANSNLKKILKGVNNHFSGSLEPLNGLKKLILLDISGTDVDSGLEYLPSNLLAFICDNGWKKEAKCQKIIDQLNKEKIEIDSPIWKRNWKKLEEDFRKGRKKFDEKQVEITKEEWKQATQFAKQIFLLWPQIEEEIKVQPVSNKQFQQIIKEKAKIKGEIKDTQYFSTWWNPNCVIVISSKKRDKYAIRLIVYEPKHKEMKEIFKAIKISNHQTLEEVQRRVDEIKEKLNSDNPVLAISRNEFSPSEFVENPKLDSKKEDVKNNPDKYLKPLDIVWRKVGKIFPIYHAAVYLGNGQVAHISGYNPLIGKMKEYQNKLKDKTTPRPQSETEWLESQILQLQKELKNRENLGQEKRDDNYFKSIFSSFDSRIAREDTKAQITSWEYFLRESEDKLIVHHPIVPFKKSRKIVEHIAQTNFIQYAKEQYDLLSKNCEHFATLCVFGAPFSEQADKKWVRILTGKKETINTINLIEEIKKSSDNFDKVGANKVLDSVQIYIMEEMTGIENENLSSIGKEWERLEREWRENKNIFKSLFSDLFATPILGDEWMEQKLRDLYPEATSEEMNKLCQLFKQFLEITGQRVKEEKERLLRENQSPDSELKSIRDKKTKKYLQQFQKIKSEIKSNFELTKETSEYVEELIWLKLKQRQISMSNEEKHAEFFIQLINYLELKWDESLNEEKLVIIKRRLKNLVQEAEKKVDERMDELCQIWVEVARLKLENKLEELGKKEQQSQVQIPPKSNS